MGAAVGRGAAAADSLAAASSVLRPNTDATTAAATRAMTRATRLATLKEWVYAAPARRASSAASGRPLPANAVAAPTDSPAALRTGGGRLRAPRLTDER